MGIESYIIVVFHTKIFKMNNASDLNWHQSKILEESDDLPHISHSRNNDPPTNWFNWTDFSI